MNGAELLMKLSNEQNIAPEAELKEMVGTFNGPESDKYCLRSRFEVKTPVNFDFKSWGDLKITSKKLGPQQ